MRTAEICPTCTALINSKCVIYDGDALENINIVPKDTLEQALGSINDAILPIHGTGAPVANAKFIGQLYVNTTTKKLYFSYAVGNGAGDWVLLS